MAKNLLIVESPAKAKTIEKYLGKDYKVVASFGHIRDLPKSKLGIEVENNFEPQYVIPKKAQKTVNTLKKEIAASSNLFLATDLDREGEAIAWHIIKASGVDEKKDSVKRITFHEITKEAIKKAVENPRKVDTNLVDAQQARRVLDRLVGYKLSPILWTKIRKGLSAGRVQSVALKLIIDREREIEAFNPEEYWSIEAKLEKDKKTFSVLLIQEDSKKIKIENNQHAEEILKKLDKAAYKVEDIKEKEVKRNPAPPFITSTLQQDAGRKLNFTTKKTMIIAQQLYEGIDLGDHGSTGLITYMRTDSVSISEQAIGKIKQYIETNYSSKYLPEKTRLFKKGKGAQEAHEAIRPTDIFLDPEKIKKHLSTDQYKLYSLIWKRTLACQMKEAKLNQVSIDISASNYTFRATGSTVIFDGFLSVYEESKAREEKKEEVALPNLKIGEELKLIKIEPQQHFTQPPPRYSEASLIKILEEKGIGRPSTYAPTLSTIKERGYVDIIDRKLLPKEIGFIVSDLLTENFSDIINLDFTAKMEQNFDKIANGSTKWQQVIADFWNPFFKQLEEKKETIERVKMPVKETNEVCPQCGKAIVIKTGRFGDFMACSGWPECKYTKPIVKSLNIKCPDCENGEIIEKRTKKGRIFYGCSTWPKCKFASWTKPANNPCKKCGGLVVEKGKKYECTKCGDNQS
jgi:DNA topoisomerase I